MLSHSTHKDFLFLLLVILIWGFSSYIQAKAAFSKSTTHLQNPSQATGDYPNYQVALHDIGNLALTISNFGYIHGGNPSDEEDPSGQFPINSGMIYLRHIGIWIGGIIDNDTLVSTSFFSAAIPSMYLGEFSPEAGESGEIVRKSNIRFSPDYDSTAVSEQDFYCRYFDTLRSPDITGIDQYDNRPHKPLNIAVKQNSYAWSYDFTEDFILFDYLITNLDTLAIHDMYVGCVVEGHVTHQSNYFYGGSDDITGYLRTDERGGASCISGDSVFIPWYADNDGDPIGGRWYYSSTRAVSGLTILRCPPEATTRNYNWFTYTSTPEYNFGPRLGHDFRHFGVGLGRPTGDKNRYYMMAHPEIDYDQLFTALSHTVDGFLPPPAPTLAADLADGASQFYVLSFGPFDLAPGDSVPVTTAYVMGDDFHVYPDDFEDFFSHYNPQDYYDRLDFTDLIDNARWARSVFDNPGYDTDGDGDAGRYVWDCYCGGVQTCFDETEEPPDSMTGCCHKEYYLGDGVPDFRPASPPPPPQLRVTSDYGKVTIRWNGKDSEEYIDFLTGEKGFEGYRVYMAEDDRLSDFVLVAGYDIDDFRIYQYNPASYRWDGIHLGMTRDSLRLLFGPDFTPEEYYDEYHYFRDRDNDRLLYFAAQDWNQSELTNPNKIHKIYPSASPDDVSDVTDEGWLRYYEYEYTIDNIQASKPYYFAVTAFNKGSFHRSVWVMESSPLLNAVRDYPLPSSDMVEEESLHTYVYPNPYRIDGGYARAGYENRQRTRSVEWSRQIHFANLPRVCKIRIYSIDGDLIKELDHYYPEGGPGSQEETWNVISRNTQAIVTGIYIWVVKSENSEQIGKLVIIK